MRKMLLAVIGAGSAAVLLTILGIQATLQWMESAPGAGGCVKTGYPMAVAGTDLVVRYQAHFQGPFWEDVEQRRSVSTTALSVWNPGEKYILQGAVVLEWEGRTLVFEIRELPPGGEVLVLEKDAQPYIPGVPEFCYGWCRTEIPTGVTPVSVRLQGNVFTVTSEVDTPLDEVHLFYKIQSPDSGLFLGGNAREITLWGLQPGETRKISLPLGGPEHTALVRIWTGGMELQKNPLRPFG